VTQEVLAEIVDGMVVGYHALGVIESAVRDGELECAGPIPPDRQSLYKELLRSLAPGEASCVVQAKAHDGVVATDDRAAREQCADLGVPVTATIGILKACCLDGTFSPQEADAILQAMVEAGFYSPVRRVSDLG
jgi:predicted nucleic acid-binding protein